MNETIESGLPTISRRMLLLGVAAVGSVPIIAAGVGPAVAKTSQSAAGYESSSSGSRVCSGCANFTEPASCKVVDGPISPGGSCKLWVKKSQ